VEIAVCHGQLVKVTKHCHVEFFFGIIQTHYKFPLSGNKI
jgi:hypothetical protein